MIRQRRVRPALQSVLVLVLVSGCEGVSPTAPSPVIPPRETLPELRSLVIAFSNDAPPASQTVAASVTATDHRGQTMSVGLVAWTSGDSTVATITSDGTILARRQGVTVITASIGLVSARRTLVILPPPAGALPIVSVTVSPLTASVRVGESTQLEATLRDFAGHLLTGRDVRWTSSDDAVVLVSSTGEVTASGVGTAVIQAISEGTRGGAVVTVEASVDTNINVAIAKPIDGFIFADTLEMYVTVRSPLPTDSVVAVIAGRSIPLRFQYVRNRAGTASYPFWVFSEDFSSSPYGAITVVVTATDALGQRGVAVVSVVRNPVLSPGSKSPPRSK